jgi:hypothetical protein
LAVVEAGPVINLIFVPVMFGDLANVQVCMLQSKPRIVRFLYPGVERPNDLSFLTSWNG